MKTSDQLKEILKEGRHTLDALTGYINDDREETRYSLFTAAEIERYHLVSDYRSAAELIALTSARRSLDPLNRYHETYQRFLETVGNNCARQETVAAAIESEQSVYDILHTGDILYRDIDALIKPLENALLALQKPIMEYVSRSTQKPVEAVVVEVAPSVREELGETVVQKLKNKGGRPKRSKRDGNYLSQGEIAKMFGPPCKTSTVSNWERFVRTNGQAGAQPPAANVRGKWIGYTPELRENYSGDNCAILAALIETYKSCHTVKTRLGTEKPLHVQNDETLYRLQHPDGRVRTENRE